MVASNISIRVDKDGALPSVAHNIRILLVDHDTNSRLFLTSQFEQQLYQVTPAESADVALSLFQAWKNYYNIVIASLHMPDMEIFKFVHELHQHNKNIPVILMAEDLTTDAAREALGCGVCYLLSKPISHQDIATLWHHIYRITGEMPSSTDTTDIDIEKYGFSDGAARNQKQGNSKRKLITAEIENARGSWKNQIAENLNSSNDTEEEDGCNSKKSRMTWTYSLHQKFLVAVNILGEQRAHPQSILRMLNEPGLTLRQISSLLQKYRDRRRHSVNQQKTLDEASGVPQNNQEGTCATGDVIRASANLSNGLQAGNQESAGDFGMGMCGLGYAGNPTEMNNANSGEGTSSTNKEFEVMSIEDSVKQVIQEFEAAVVNSWPD
ncbi:hypothetical protein POM88_027502 [Heracleum sosnowskyi]|uniref:Response regulatory domain-containing protein n=1 Tax=Heracleum sosnowskyi TaxID=360622 RepID=A0AAD8IA82_9APIA|nr:hypothetical protein POM88_027502 [Heracleum sosnowskyi]